MFTEVDDIILRIFEATLTFSLLCKSLYFMMLNEEIAPLINIIFKVLGDIAYFLEIFLVFEVAFILGFYCLGKNQQQLAMQNGDLDEIDCLQRSEANEFSCLSSLARRSILPSAVRVN